MELFTNKKDRTFLLLTSALILATAGNCHNCACALKEIEISGRIWLWYNTESFNINRSIDVLVIDGPPGYVQKLARYPAVPILYKNLNAPSKIIVDDGRREDEKTIVALWEKEFDGLQSEFFETENGAFVISKNSHETTESSG